MFLKSLRRFAGYFMADNRNSEGVSDEFLNAAHPTAELHNGAGKGLLECDTYTCSHCQVVLIINHLRTRERAYCTGCDHIICDRCGAIRASNGGLCKTFKQLADELQEMGARQMQATQSGLLLPAKAIDATSPFIIGAEQKPPAPPPSIILPT